MGDEPHYCDITLAKMVSKTKYVCPVCGRDLSKGWFFYSENKKRADPCEVKEIRK